MCVNVLLLLLLLLLTLAVSFSAPCDETRLFCVVSRVGIDFITLVGGAVITLAFYCCAAFIDISAFCGDGDLDSVCDDADIDDKAEEEEEEEEEAERDRDEDEACEVELCEFWLEFKDD